MPLRRSLMGGSAAALTALALPEIAQARTAAPPTRATTSPKATPIGSPASTPIGPLDTAARQAIVLDFDSGAVLLEKNPDERMTPSSMSKLMTVYVAFDMLKQGRLKLEQEMPVSERAWRMGGSKMFVQVGSTVKVADLLQGVIVQSGNDACVVLAEGISGSETQFAELLNDYARRIGLTGSTFKNSNGWPEPEHKMTARDLATLARRIIADFPEDYRYFNERSFTWNNITQENRNPMLARVAGADGLKTGHTAEAGFGLVGSAARGGQRLIVVLNGLPTMRARSEESARMVEWGFREFERVVLYKAGERVDEAPVYLGAAAKVPLVPATDIILVVPRQARKGMQAKAVFDAPVAAPVTKGQEIGRLEIAGTGVPPVSFPLGAANDVAKLGVLSRIPAVVGHWWSGS